MTRLRPPPLALALALSTTVACGVDDASVLLQFIGPADQVALFGVEARLTLTDEDGGHPTLRVKGVGDDPLVSGENVPLPCDDRTCGGQLVVEPGKYNAVVAVSAVDRCGARGPILSFTGAFEVGYGETADKLEVALDDASFDADRDGVIDVLEAGSCGRFDFDEGAQPPRQCAGAQTACCTRQEERSEGHMQTFEGGTTTVPYDLDGDGDGVTPVAAFALDATEVTWGQVERCVLAGRCFVDEPDHPARVALAGGVDRRLPAQGLLPVDAAAVCAHHGKLLPDDAAWDFAAAHRVDGAGVVTRARYPIDVAIVDGVADGSAIGCKVVDPPPATGHRRALTAGCPASPLRVGSYASSGSSRGVGAAPMFDLAGNVAEWTLVRGVAGDDAGDAVDADNDGIPDDVVAVVLRGGGVKSFVELLENDLPLVFEVASAADRLALRTAAAEVGFRCAAAVAPVVDDEPACPVLPDDSSAPPEDPKGDATGGGSTGTDEATDGSTGRDG